MRRLLPVFGLLIVCMMCFSGPVEAKEGKGGGGRGKPSFGGGHGPKWSGPKSAQGGHKEHGKREHLADSPKKPPKEKKLKETKPKERGGDSDDATGGTDTSDESAQWANKKEKQLQIFQRQRDKKLAQAEHLRQIAEQNGNANLAANADRMEAQAHQQYAQKVAHLEKFGVTDQPLNPGGEIVRDQLPTLNSP